MVASSKRTAAEAGFSHSHCGIGQTLHNITATQASNTTYVDGTESNSMNAEGSATVTSQDWAVAESKSSRKKRRKIERESDGDPSISFFKTRPERVDLKALQDLVLYILADGVAPTWLAVKNARQIKKVVVLMVPALDQKMLEDSELWNSISEESEMNSMSKPDESFTHPDSTAQAQHPASADASAIISPPEADSDLPPQPKLRDSLLRHIIEVRAPGDSRINRVHSPLQGMLIAPFSESTKQREKHGKDEKSFQAVRTPVVNFVHAVSELREAEYPIHPAAFADPKDAQLEKERREKTGQSKSSGWVDTDVSIFKPRILPSSSPPKSHDFLTQGLKAYALDCEMVLTSDEKYSLARISVLDWAGRTVLDRYVKPALAIKNYFTEFSGITQEILENVTTTLGDIQRELLNIVGQDTILLGHSLESDLNALKLTHPFVIDTSIIYPHPRGLPLRSSLKFLANRYLKREIQKGGMSGHDSVEDARAVLDLVKLKCDKGPTWGTLDANGESIFRRIGGTLKMSANGEVVLKTTAIVEYGTPERGLGRDATYKIGCANDDEIVRGVLRAAHGDSVENSTVAEHGKEDGAEEKRTSHSGEGETQDHDQTIPLGGTEFIWARLRDLEAARGWNTLPSDSFLAPASSSSSSRPLPSDQTDHLRSVMRQTLQRIYQIYANLPRRTLLAIYSGTGDMRPLLRLQNLQAQYRREFKVKKWDELSVKWTDVEEQEMKKECERARRGVGVLAIR
ncbi:uncharacterized protein A1O5_02445 [Cladophialophora psammophila CBS 110553]|uniref:Exonuclease domain-containing protein n=1 Tax=Cladophialophora psammophila CBS 110553 TaxID=1182543 RepID=W9XB50_9EURO|nr:uncharacterized protein A1O5_02445 [Cladophialophora psammophila CBS 110553]EXJ74151.1 hypothetical protein A1O5_02445 [Cladophialophora psammophila CBS 110553]